MAVTIGVHTVDSVQRNKGGSSMNMAKPSKPLLEVRYAAVCRCHACFESSRNEWHR